MKKLIALSLLVIAACATKPKVQLLQPEIAIQQVPISSFLLQYSGPISVSYQMAVRNPSSEPITLRRLDLQVLGTGPYTIRRFPLTFKQVIAPDATEWVNFSVQAYSRGGRLGVNEPLTLRGIAYFEAPSGQFHRMFTQHIRPGTTE